jgi:hypothetical protein
MAGGVCVLARVLIWGTVTTKRHAALLACPKMNPASANLGAVRTFRALRVFDRRDRLEV